MHIEADTNPFDTTPTPRAGRDAGHGRRHAFRKAARRGAVALAALLAVSVAAPSGAIAAVTYGFKNITNNDATDAAAGEAQLFVDVSDAGNSEVLFNFRNIGPDPMSITAVYFDDGTLLELARLIDADDNSGDAGVDFTQDAVTSVSPPDLPGGNDIDFDTTVGFSADADAPTQPNGVNPNETLGVVFTLQNQQTYQDTLAALTLSQGNLEQDIVGGLRIGIRVQGYEGGGSEGYVNYSNGNGNEIPVPASLLFFGLGLVSLGAFLRRRTAA